MNALELVKSAIARARALKKEIADRENGVPTRPVQLPDIKTIQGADLFDGEKIK